jgi:hypothetical protein
LDLRPRDIVHIRTAGNAQSSILTSRYWGWVVQSPSRAAPGLSETRLMGGRLRYAEQWTAHTEVGLNDVDAVVAARLVASPAAPLLPEPTSNFPVLGFSPGVRQPRLESRAETLDALAAMMPEFTVEPSSSYTYDGVTYDPGDLVPPVSWGFRAVDGVPGAALWFGRAQGVWSGAEVAGNLIIEWEPVSAEEVVDRVYAVLFDQPLDGTVVSRHNLRQDSPFLPVGVFAQAWRDPAALIKSGTEWHAGRVVAIPPLEGLEKSAWVGAQATQGLSNVNNMVDGSASTYASNAGTNQVLWGRQVTEETVALRVHYSSFVEMRVQVRIGVTVDLGNGRGTIYDSVLPVTDGHQSEVVVLLPRVQQSGSNPVMVELRTIEDLPSADQVRVYELEPLRVAEDRVDAIARSHFRLPLPAAASITVPNSIAAPKPRVSVVLADSSVFTGRAEVFESSVTRDTGLSTVIRVNHSLPAAAAGEAAALGRRFHATRLAAARA